MLDTRTFVAGGGVSEGAPGQHAPSLGADVMTVSAASLFDDTVASVAPPVAQAALNSLDGEHSRFLSGADWIRDFHPTHHLVSAHGLELLV